MPNSYWVIGALLGILQIIGIFISAYGFFLLKFNDLKHLGIDVAEIKASQKNEEAKIEKIEIAQATQKAICDERKAICRGKGLRVSRQRRQ